MIDFNEKLCHNLYAINQVFKFRHRSSTDRVKRVCGSSKFLAPEKWEFPPNYVSIDDNLQVVQIQQGDFYCLSANMSNCDVYSSNVRVSHSGEKIVVDLYQLVRAWEFLKINVNLDDLSYRNCIHSLL